MVIQAIIFLILANVKLKILKTLSTINIQNKMKNYLLTIITTLLTVASFAQSFTVDGLNYNVIDVEANQVAVTGGTATDNLIIPESITVDEVVFEVTEIGTKLFQRTNFTSITLPATITNLAEDAFRFSEIEVLTSLSPNPPALERSVLSSRDNIKVTVPDGQEEVYRNGGWGDFFTINNIPSIGITFTVDDLNYSVIGNTPNSVTLTGGTTTDNLIIPASVTDRGFTYQVTEIASNTFRDTNFTSINLPATITNLGEAAFRFSEIAEITSLSPNPPALERNVFNNRENINLTIPNSQEGIYLDGGWTNFATVNGFLPVGSTFTDGDFNFLITSKNPFTASLTSYESENPNPIIPSEAFVALDNSTYSVTIISSKAFRDAAITSVVIPNTVTFIGDEAFRFTQLTSVTIPQNVKSIGANTFGGISTLEEVTIIANIESISFLAFGSSNITKVTSFSTNPIVIGASAGIFASQDDEIDLFIPIGSTANYQSNGWGNFKSITEINLDITLNLKVFLQGAYINPNTAEQDLRNDLQEAALIPLTSTYADERSAARTFDTIDFFSPFELKIVDWILVEIRDANEPTIILDSRSLLLQTNGDIIDFTFDSEFTNVTFNKPSVDEYLVVIKHRNHISIQTASAISSDQSFVNLDFTSDPTLVEGGENAQTEVSEGIFAMIAGDFDANGQVQPSDVNTTTAAIGTSTYSSADMDMNGQIQPADVNNLVNPNVGRGVQF